MKRLMAYKFRLRCTPRTRAFFARFAGCRRFVWNKALALNEARFKAGEKRLSYVAMAKELTKWRNDPETAWLADAPCQTQQQTLRDLEQAYANFFAKRAAKPEFKKKGKSRESFRYSDPAGFSVDATNERVKLPKVGWVRYRNSRRVEGSPRNLTISQDGEHWFVSILVEQDIPDPVHPHPDSAVGIDVGVVNFATLSTGESVPPVNAFRGIETRLARLQRRLSQKVKFSSNWRKQKRRIAALHRKAARRRHDFLHKLSHAVSKNHATVSVEALNVQAMSASAKGTVEAPGKRVRQKAGLNKSILDQGWSEFRRQLAYKLTWHGGRLVEVPPAYTSQTCSRCGHCRPENRPSQARFCCVACGLELNADHNAALNVHAAGLAVSACGGEPRQAGGLTPGLDTPLKQEPTRVRPGIPRL